MLYSIQAAGITYAGDTNRHIPGATVYSPIETFELSGFLDVVRPLRPEETNTPAAHTLNGGNIADVGLYVANPLAFAQAGALWWASLAAMHYRNTAITGGNLSLNEFVDVAFQEWFPADGVLRSRVDTRVAPTVPFSEFLWISGNVRGSPKTIVDGVLDIDFSPNFRKLTGKAEFVGEGAAGAYAISFEFSGTLDQRGRLPAFMKAETGSGSADRMTGSRREDDLSGRGGGDVIRGGGGADALHGDGGNDKLFGQKGGDLLDGGAGRDVMVGGGGRDAFLFEKGDGRRDLVRDFSPGHDDIVIGAGAARFRQLDIERHDGDAKIAFANVVFHLHNVDARDLEKGDFVFL